MKNDKIKVSLVGAGAVGLYFCGRLAQNADMDVEVVARGDYHTVNACGFYDIKSIAGDFIFRPAQMRSSVAECRPDNDFVVLTAKILPEIDRVKLLKDVVRPCSTIVLIQNGVDIEREIAEAFPDNELISVIAYIGVNRPASGKVDHQGGGRLEMGSYPKGISANVEKLAGLFGKVGVECKMVDDIVLYRWMKLVWNAPFNPVSVLSGGMDTKEMVSEPLLRELCFSVMREVIAIAASCNVALPQRIAEDNMAYTEDFPAYKTSMLQDFEASRPIEVEAILGNALKLARRNSVAAPHMETMYALLNAQDIKLRQRITKRG